MASSHRLRCGGLAHGGCSEPPLRFVGQALRCSWCERGAKPHTKHPKDPRAQPNLTQPPTPSLGRTGGTPRHPLSSLRTCPSASASAEDSEKCARVSTDQPAPVSKAGWPLAAAEPHSKPSRSKAVSECNAQRRRPPLSGAGRRRWRWCSQLSTLAQLAGRPCQPNAVSPGASDTVALLFRTKCPPPDNMRLQWGGAGGAVGYWCEPSRPGRVLT